MGVVWRTPRAPDLSPAPDPLAGFFSLQPSASKASETIPRAVAAESG
jgi:hypothetical protein